MEPFEEIIEKLHEETGLDRELVRNIIQDFVGLLLEYGAADYPVYLTGLGEFETKVRKEFMFEDSLKACVTLYPPEKVARFKSRRDN